MKFTIMQLPDGDGKLFMDYEYAIRNGGVDTRKYVRVYEGETDGKETDVYEVLENLFRIFNCCIPYGYTGRALSVSDIVCIDGEGSYFCDSVGWKKV